MLEKDLIKLKKDCCKDNVDYFKIKSRFKYMNNTTKYQHLDYNEKYLLCKNRYLKKLNYDNLKNIFNILNTTTNIKDYQLICKELNINYKRARKISYKNKNLKKTILYIWFFGDTTTENGKSISRKKLYQVNSKKILKHDTDIYNIIVYYICGYKEYLDSIIKLENKYIKSICYKVLNNLNVEKTTDKINELMSEAIIILITTLNKIIINDIKYIVKYLNITL